MKSILKNYGAWVFASGIVGLFFAVIWHLLFWGYGPEELWVDGPQSTTLWIAISISWLFCVIPSSPAGCILEDKIVGYNKIWESVQDRRKYLLLVPFAVFGLPIVFSFLVVFGITVQSLVASLDEKSAIYLKYTMIAIINGYIVPTIIALIPYWFVRRFALTRESPWFRKYFLIGQGASARWCGVSGYNKKIKQAKVQRKDAKGKKFTITTGIRIGTTTFSDDGLERNRAIFLNDDAHMLTVGCQGSGKSATVIWPVLAQYPGSAVVLDPKGEHARMTYFRRSDRSTAERNGCKYTKSFMGKSCYKLDPFDQEPDIPSSNYNPLAEIDISDDRARERLAAISDGCVLPEGERNKHWVEGAKMVLEGFIAHVLSAYPEENHNLPFIHDLLTEYDPEHGVADPDQLDNALIEMRANKAAGGICAQAASMLGDRQGEGYKSMMTTIQRSIKWIGDPSMRRHLSRYSNFKFSEIRDGDTVYIVAPLGPLMKEQVRWLRVLTNFSLTVMRNAPPQEFRTLFILDEFPQLGGQLSAITEGIVTLRSAGIKLWPFIQQIGQIKADYGESWNTFISSSDIQVFGVTDPETAQWVCQYLGEYMHTRKADKKVAHQGTRPLLTPQEIMEVFGKNEPKQIVITNDGSLPMRLNRRAFKLLSIEGKRFMPYDGLSGCFEDPPS